MFYVYVLQSEKDKKLYIGATNNLKRRFREHQIGKSKATMPRRPFKLVSYIAVENEKIGRKLEEYLKKGSGKAFLKKRILTDEA